MVEKRHEKNTPNQRNKGLGHSTETYATSPGEKVIKAGILNGHSRTIQRIVVTVGVAVVPERNRLGDIRTGRTEIEMAFTVDDTVARNARQRLSTNGG